MNPSPYSGTKNTALARQEEDAVAKMQGTYKAPTPSFVPPPQPPAYVAPSWVTQTSTPSEAYGLDSVEQARFNQAKSGSTSTQQSEEQIFNDTLRRYQAEIDATNSIFSNKLQDAKRAGLERSGSQYAQQARGGLLGSDFGNAQDNRIVNYNKAVEGGIQDEQRLAISEILGKARAGAKEELAAKKVARDNDYAAYKELLTTSATRKNAKTNAYAQELLAKGTTLEKLLGLDVNEFSGTGLAKQEVVNAFKEAQLENEKLQLANRKIEADIAKAGQFDLSEGQARYDAAGSIIAQRGKTYAPSRSSGSKTSTGMTGGSALLNGKPVSSAAQNILNIMNTSGGSVDDYVKGTSIASQNLRNELFQALSNQGGSTKTTQSILSEGKAIVDDLLNTKGYKALGGYSTVFGSLGGTGYGDAKAKATQLSAILAKDNLGLLKGAMSDKDLAFIQSMSTGFEGEGVQSEGYIQNRLKEIQKKLNNKLATTTQQQPTNQTVNPVDSTLSEFGL